MVSVLVCNDFAFVYKLEKVKSHRKPNNEILVSLYFSLLKPKTFDFFLLIYRALKYFDVKSDEGDLYLGT